MARSRLALHELLVELVGEEVPVYFQQKTDLSDPYVRYERSTSRPTYADNIKYRNLKGYSVTVVDRNPDSLIPDLVEGLRNCTFDRFYRTEGLNHFVFQLFI